MEKISKKQGFTLIELMVVVAIMGILAGLGVSGFGSMIAKSRVKDGAMNTTAFLERMAGEANRMSSKVCVKVSNQTLISYKGACADVTENTQRFSSFQLESENKYISGNCGSEGNNYGSQIEFAPKLGISAAPAGCLRIKYGTSDYEGAAVKRTTKNSMTYLLSNNGGSNWEE